MSKSKSSRAPRVVLVAIATMAAVLPSAGALEEAGSDDFRISIQGTDGDAAADAQQPDVAYNSAAGEYLVVWSGDNSGGLADDEFEIWAQRVDAETDALVGAAIRVSDMGPPGDMSYEGLDPAVSYNSRTNEYLVVWSGDDNTAPLVNDEKEIFGQRLTASGTEVGADDFRISHVGVDGVLSTGAGQPAVTYNSLDNEWYVVWAADGGAPLGDNEAEIFGQRVTAAGSEIGTNDARLSDTGVDGDTNAYSVRPTVTHSPTNNTYLVTFSGLDPLAGAAGGAEVYGQLVTANGTEIGTNDFRISHAGVDGDANVDASLSSAAVDPTTGRFLVVWVSDDSNAGLADNEGEVFGQLLGPTGAAVGPDFRISQSLPDGELIAVASLPTVTFQPQAREFVVAFPQSALSDEDEIAVQTVSLTGAETGPNDLHVTSLGPDGDASFAPGAVGVASSARSGDVLVVTTSDDTTNDEFEIYGQRLRLPVAAGYRMIAADGGTFALGDRHFHGSLSGVRLHRPIVGGAMSFDDGGQWQFGADGGVFAQGDATFFGSLSGIPLSAPIVAGAATPFGDGYWMFGADGAVYAFGNATYRGSMHGRTLGAPITAGIATATGDGYWLIGADGGVFAFGDATYHGSHGGIALNAPITAALATSTGNGYWLIATDGGVFSYGDAGYHGSHGGIALNAPITAALATSAGDGYWLFATDGGVFSYGDATYYGSLGGTALAAPIVAAT